MSTSEANGRSSLFVGQISHLATAFFVFSLVVLPTLDYLYGLFM
jgi:hypothetical protein